MNLGRYQLGMWVPLQLWCSTEPDVPPFVSIYDSTGRRVLADKQLAPRNKAVLTGNYIAEHRLGPEFEPGLYHVLYEYRISSATENRSRLDSFSVIAGGQASGAYVGMHFFSTPQADFVVGVTDGGRLEARRNPRT